MDTKSVILEKNTLIVTPTAWQEGGPLWAAAAKAVLLLVIVIHPSVIIFHSLPFKMRENYEMLNEKYGPVREKG